MKIRNGKVVGALLEGNYDLKRLDSDQVSKLDTLVKKQAAGRRLSGQDIIELMRLRSDARTAAQPDPMSKLSTSLAELKQAFQP